MYCVGRNIVHRDKLPEMHAHLLRMTMLANNLSNAALFRLRQNFTGRLKESPTPLETEVVAEISAVCSATGKKKPSSVISYTFLEKMMRLTNNPDFFAGLPMQSAQQVLRERIRDMRGWLSSLREYKKNPACFTGKPRMPKYLKKGGRHTFAMTNQDCVIERKDDGTFLKLPLISVRLRIENIPEDAVLKEVKVVPYYDEFEVLYTYECGAKPASGLSACAAIDFGVDNTAAIVTNEGSSLLVKGGAIKADNQWFNKQKARYVSALTKGYKTEARPHSHMLNSLSKNRRQFMLDACHQISSRIIAWCVEHHVGTVVIGKTKHWKQEADIGKRNNQAFVAIPFDMLREMIAYKAKRHGIRVIEQEESYTSRASFLDNDPIPVYGVNDRGAVFSGRRRGRGIYVSKAGTMINADINGAANILRKALQGAFEDVDDFTYLQKPQVMHFTDLHKGTPVKGIAVA